MPILQDVLAKLKEKSAATAAPVDLRTVTPELIEAGYTYAQVMHAVENLRNAKVIDVEGDTVTLR